MYPVPSSKCVFGIQAGRINKKLILVSNSIIVVKLGMQVSILGFHDKSDQINFTNGFNLLIS